MNLLYWGIGISIYVVGFFGAGILAGHSDFDSDTSLVVQVFWPIYLIIIIGFFLIELPREIGRNIGIKRHG